MPKHASLTHTERKNVRLTPETRTIIQAWATREGLSFSAAIEALARFGLRRVQATSASRSAAAPPPVFAPSTAVVPEQD
jgi:hypothetical protein